MIPILSGNVASALPSGYEVANSCRFNSADSGQVSKSVGSSATTKYTLSLWVKRGLITNGTGNGQRFFTSTGGSGLGDTYFRFNTDDTIEISGHGSSATAGGYVITNRLFRDPSAWMHIVIRYDSTESSANDRFRLYINGVDERTGGGYSTSTMPNSSVADNITASGNTIRIGAMASGQYFDGYIAEVHFSEGQSYAPTEFGEYDEDSPTIWKPKKADISYGTSGFHLDFEDSSNMGNDANGGTDFTETNIDATDQATDTCTNNFCTLNPLWRSAFDNDGSMSQGNCKGTFTSANSDRGYLMTTMGVTSGKWYWEAKVIDKTRMYIGIAKSSIMEVDEPFYDETTYNAVAINNSGEVYGRYTGSAIDQFNTSVSTADNDILGFALDMDNKALYIHKNGTYMNSGSPTSGSSRTGCLIDELTASRDLYIPDNEFIFPFMHDPSTSGQLDIEFNFGGCPAFSISSGNADGNGYGNFEYAVPSSYFSLNTKNLAEYGG